MFSVRQRMRLCVCCDGAKMEAGENPARSRHCNEGALLSMPLHLCFSDRRWVWEGE